MAKVVWPKAVIEQLNQIIAYIKISDPAAADRIGTSPYGLGKASPRSLIAGRPALDDTREIVTVRPYIVRYEVRGDTATILGIHHTAQLPDIN